MIILDSNILKGTSLRGAEAELLRAIRTTRVERVAAPWIVLEELAAQQALLYDQKFEAAQAAIETLDKATPWRTVYAPTRFDSERVRKHWRARYGEIVETLPTSPHAYEQAMFREANLLAPCKTVNSGKHKTGSRDAAIWLTAVEYTRENPDEVVYFVSNNTEDFGDGSSFEPPMNEDLSGIEGRFVLLTSLGSVLTKFATEAQVDEEELTELLQRPLNHRAVNRDGRRKYNFTAALLAGPEMLQDIACKRWDGPLNVAFSSVNKIAAHEIAGHRWYTATARWLISGPARVIHDDLGYPTVVNCAWETRVLLSPTAPSKGLTVIGAGSMVPPSIDDIPSLPPQDGFDPKVSQWADSMSAREREIHQRLAGELYTRALLERSGNRRLSHFAQDTTQGSLFPDDE